MNEMENELIYFLLVYLVLKNDIEIILCLINRNSFCFCIVNCNVIINIWLFLYYYNKFFFV